MYKAIHHLPLTLVMVVLIANVTSPSALAGSSDYQVKVIDLNPEQGIDFQPIPAIGTYRQGLIYFQGRTDDGIELYVSDGTQSGTRQLIDLMPGPDGSEPAEFTRVGPMENANSRVFFVAETPASGRELWVSSGTVVSTLLAADFMPGPGDGIPSSLTAWNGQLYLSADAGAGRHLYQLDRATLGVTPLGSTEFEMALDAELVTTPSALYFAATAQATGQIEVWSTDGTGVTQVTTTGCESIDDLHVAGSDSVFMVCKRAGSIDVLEVDQTQSSGTILIQSHVGGESITEELSNTASVLYWVLDSDQLWGYDESLPMAGIVADYGSGGNIRGLTRLGPRMLFIADSGDGFEPHVAEGFFPTQLLDVFPGPETSILFTILVSHDGWVYFMADDGVTGYELWRTDGTPAGTLLFADIEPGSASSLPVNLLSSPLGLFFSTNGSGLWASDGATVTRVDNLQKSSSNPTELLHDPIASRLFMTLSNAGLGKEPWVSDGTDAGSFLLGDIRDGASSSTSDLLATLPDQSGAAQDSLLVFSANDGVAGRQLWRSDGTPVGTEALATINPSDSAKIEPGVLFGEHYYFAGDDGTTGLELWRTDATTSGTELYADINPTGGSISDSSPQFVVFDERLFFTADDDLSGRELWFTDGISPPALFADLLPGSIGSMPGELTATPSRLYFTAEGSNDDFLWRSDGTLAGSEPILPSGTSSVIAVGDGVYFRHDDGSSGLELWRADADSVELALDLTPGPDSSTIGYVGVIDEKLIFRSLGTELWVINSDTGQASLLGTFEEIDVQLGERLGEHLYFRAESAGEGSELWRTDGATIEMIDLEPGTASSNPVELVAGNDRLWFFAYDSTVKEELHILRLLPAISFAPDPVLFDGVDVGNTAFVTVSISNTGSATLEPAAATIGGINPTDFSIQLDNCSGAQLTAGQSCSIELTYSPSEPGLRRAVLLLPSNVQGGAAELPLRGRSDSLFADDFEFVQ